MRYIRIPFITALAALAASCGSDSPDNDEPAPPSAPSGMIAVEVLDYSPAPGQFVNIIPAWHTGDRADDMCRRATEMLNRGNIISLGAWGGSVTLRLKSPVVNGDGGDFAVIGNAYRSGLLPDGRAFGSSEPGIVEVMRDDNGNRLPDDTWYELRGEAHDSSVADFSVTYHAPALDATNDRYIRWEASDGSEGWINRVEAYHQQPFMPAWSADTQTMTFHGRRLADNGMYIDGASMYGQLLLRGYADSMPDNDPAAVLDIDDAIDNAGRAVKLTEIHFVRITTGVLQCNGPLGECSTEVGGLRYPRP